MHKLSFTGQIIVVSTIFIIALAFCVFTLVHWLEIYETLYSHSYGSSVSYKTLSAFLLFGAVFDLCWAGGIVGMSLMVAGAGKLDNLPLCVTGLLTWIIFLPAFFGLLYPFFIIADSVNEPWMMVTVYCLLIISYVSASQLLPVIKYQKKWLLLAPPVILVLGGGMSIALMFHPDNDDLLLSLVPLEVAYLGVMAFLIVFYFKAMRSVLKKESDYAAAGAPGQWMPPVPGGGHPPYWR